MSDNLPALGIENYLLPCLNKQLFGIDCLGCGAQRALILVFQGEFKAAFTMYPAIYTLMLLGAFLVLNLFLKFKFAYRIKIGLILINALIIITSYILKLSI